jgi:hypothetical protein
MFIVDSYGFLARIIFIGFSLEPAALPNLAIGRSKLGV